MRRQRGTCKLSQAAYTVQCHVRLEVSCKCNVMTLYMYMTLYPGHGVLVDYNVIELAWHCTVHEILYGARLLTHHLQMRSHQIQPAMFRTFPCIGLRSAAPIAVPRQCPQDKWHLGEVHPRLKYRPYQLGPEGDVQVSLRLLSRGVQYRHPSIPL